ncbi:TetR/AcrR family transcriptional regulator [Psychromonas antarctica]|uniref:TetR/AcrR family transcriptional regulator n=1 Tax=Psychromonas antarctica TaxID=67573 RepID=UPI001EE7F3F8|nr:TetR/AcrR family transcriptional regulator [Psychromonas antarctica]MCG6201658.1 TetR/AcrR family transcriptional regulator [Psychromonas antarctica]
MNKRSNILNAAETLLAERGFYGFSMKLLADNAGIAAGTIYRYFENKDALITELYRDINLKISQTSFEGWQGTQSPQQKYNLLWRNVFNGVSNNPKRLAVIEMLFSQPHLAPENTALCSGDEFAPLINFYQQGIDQGLFHNWQIAALISLSFDSSINLAKKVLREDLQLDEQQIDQVRDASWLIIQKI